MVVASGVQQDSWMKTADSSADSGSGADSGTGSSARSGPGSSGRPSTNDSQQTPASPHSQEQSPLRRRLGFRLAAIAVGLVPFALFEAGLRLAGVAAPDRDDDLLVGYSQIEPLFELDESESVYRTRRSRELFFGTQQFAAKKPDNGFRIFSLGGSTVRGRPYETDSAFAKWLEIELAACDPSRTFESVNCGGLSYASYRLRVLLDEVLQYEPDLIIIATGHNEFLEDRTYASLKNRSAVRAWLEDTSRSLRTVRLARQMFGGSQEATGTSSESPVDAAGGSSAKTDDQGRTLLGDHVQTRLDDPTGYASYHRDPDWRAGVIQHFEISIRAMIDRCREAGVPLLLVNLGSNLRDTAPFKSEFSRELSATDELKWQQAFDAATALDRSSPAPDVESNVESNTESNAERALGEYRVAESIDHGHALLLYRIARCLDRLGKYDDARSYYLRAKDEDVCPLRMIDEMYEAQQQIAAETGTPIVDARVLLDESSAQSIPGHDWYTDHVHPTIFGHQQIARAIATAMRQRGWPAGLADWEDNDRRAAFTRHFTELGPTFVLNGRRRVGWLEGWAQRNRLYDETLPVDSRGFLHSGFRKIGFGEPDAAWLDFGIALKLRPEAASELKNFANELTEQGRSQAADDLLKRLESRW